MTGSGAAGFPTQGGGRTPWHAGPALGPVLGPVLGIESSCDETACAILGTGGPGLDGPGLDGKVLAEAVLSQSEHRDFGGVVPEIAARAHLAHLPELVRRVLREAGIRPADLGAVAASCGPGLIGGLIVGSSLGKGLALSLGIPFVPVNHIEAHALTARLPGLVPEGAAFPYLLLLVSGGHCQCIAVDGLGHYRRLGGTIDDAAGEAFDKVAKMLGLGWPGGPALERLALEGDPAAIASGAVASGAIASAAVASGGGALPRPLLGRPGCDFSFSGLKTAVAQRLAHLPPGAALPRAQAADLAAGFQAAVADVLADRITHAIAMMPEATLLVAAGGVAANATLRKRLSRVAEAHGLRFAAPPLRLCTDNAVMVTWAAIERLRAGIGGAPGDGLDAPPRPRWPLQEMGGADGPADAVGSA